MYTYVYICMYVCVCVCVCVRVCVCVCVCSACLERQRAGGNARMSSARRRRCVHSGAETCGCVSIQYAYSYTRVSIQYAYSYTPIPLCTAVLRRAAVSVFVRLY